MTKMTQNEMRSIAIESARSWMRAGGIDPMTASIYDFEVALNELVLGSGSTPISSRWYNNASDNQWNLFKRDVRKWQKQAKRLYELFN